MTCNNCYKEVTHVTCLGDSRLCDNCYKTPIVVTEYLTRWNTDLQSKLDITLQNYKRLKYIVKSILIDLNDWVEE